MRLPYGKNILITGASSGIGLASALLFAEAGFNVWGVSRSGSPLDTIPVAIRMHSMDVTDERSVCKAIDNILSEAVATSGEGIGIVLHCAGYGIGGAAEDTPAEAVEKQFMTNYFGVLNVNRYLLKKTRDRKNMLVLVTGSVAGKISIPFQSHYSSSKYALEAYVEALRIEGRPLGIRASIIEPGDTKTKFTSQRTLAFPDDSPYLAQGKRSIKKMEHDEQHGADPKHAAAIALRLSKKLHPPVRVAVGFSSKMILFAKRIVPDWLAECIIAKLYAR